MKAVLFVLSIIAIIVVLMIDRQWVFEWFGFQDWVVNIIAYTILSVSGITLFCTGYKLFKDI